MITRLIAWLKARKELRRRRRVARLMWENALDSYDYFIGLDSGKGEDSGKGKD